MPTFLETRYTTQYGRLQSSQYSRFSVIVSQRWRRNHGKICSFLRRGELRVFGSCMVIVFFVEI